MGWWDVKLWLAQSSGLHMDALHVHAGVIGQLLAACVLRRSIGHPMPWLLLLAAVLANEYYDLQLETWPDRAVQYQEGVRDAWNTMLLPTLLLLAARLAPGLLVRQRAAEDASPPTEISGG